MNSTLTGRRADLSGGVARVWLAPPGTPGPQTEGPWPPWPAPWRPLGTGPASATLDGRAVVVDVAVWANPPWPPEAAVAAAALRAEATSGAPFDRWAVGLDWGRLGRAVVGGATVDGVGGVAADEVGVTVTGWEADRDVWSVRFVGVGVGAELTWWAGR